MSVVSQYYENEVQQVFERTLREAGPEIAAQPDFTTTYQVGGAEGGTYGLRVAQGALAVVPGGIPESDMHIVANVDEWRAGLDVGMAHPFYYYQKRKIDLLKSFRGKVMLELAQPGGEPLRGSLVFGGTEDPAVTLRMAADDYLAMMSGRLNGQMAFLTGKLKFDGSLPLLMQLAALNS